MSHGTVADKGTVIVVGFSGALASIMVAFYVTDQGIVYATTQTVPSG